jgi:TM2 domain-containing membrane protein YozV
MLQRALLALVVLLVQAQIAGAAMEVEQVRELLQKLQDDEVWGEAVFADGRVRSFRVVAQAEESVEVVEVVGALQERPATYGLNDFRSLRELGEYRIQPRRAAFQPQKSALVAYVLEAVVPGAGYFYIGQNKQGLALLGLTALAAVTAFATGEDGAAGWVPISVWIKISSLTNLRDQVSAINASGMQASMELGALQGREDTVPALRLNLVF